MTVALNDALTTFLGDGVTTAFDFDFPAETDTQIAVFVDGVLIDANDYSVEFNPSQVVLNVAPATGTKGAIIRLSQITQEILYSRTDNSMNVAALATQLDNIVLKLQEVDRDASFAVKTDYNIAAPRISGEYTDGAVLKYDNGVLVPGPNAGQLQTDVDAAAASAAASAASAADSATSAEASDASADDSADSAAAAAASAASIDPTTLLHKDQNLNDLIDKAQARNILAVAVYVADRTALKALDTTKDVVAYLRESGREGQFVWSSSDLSAYITADTLEGIYIAPTSDATGASGAWVRQGEWFATGVLPEWFGAVGDGATDDAAAFNAAIKLLTAVAGGRILPGPKTYAVGNQNSGAVSTFDQWAIVFDQGNDNIALCGVPGATKITLLDDANCTVIQIGRNTNTAPVNGITITGIEIDGNRANQDAPEASTKHWPGIMGFAFGGVSSGIVLEDLYVHDCQYYGIGFQMEDAVGTEYHNCHVRNVVIEDTGADCFDAKDYQNGSRGNTIENITVRRWGLANADSTLLSGQAGIDLRSGWVVENAFIDELNDAAIPDQVGIRIQVGSVSTVPVQPSRVSKFTAHGSDEETSTGVRIIAIDATVTDGYVDHFNEGVSASNQHCKFVNVVARLNVNGARFWAASGTTAAMSSAEGCNFRENTGTGVIVAGADSVSLINTEVRSNLVGLSVDASSTNFRMIGGSLTGNTTQTSITTVIPYIQNVSGFRTKRAYSTTARIDSTGSKDTTIAHGLPFTPRIQDCQVSFYRSTAVTDWSAAMLYVLSTDATNVVVSFRVDTASATASAVTGLNVLIDAFNGI